MASTRLLKRGIILVYNMSRYGNRSEYGRSMECIAISLGINLSYYSFKYNLLFYIF